MNNLFSSSIGGVQDKYIEDGFLYKIDRDGYESIAEAVVSELCRHIVNIGDFVDYELTNESGICRCKLVNAEVINIHDVICVAGELQNFRMGSPVDRLSLVEKVLTSIMRNNYHDYIRKVIFLDYITLNEDRHLGNLHIVKKNGIYSNGIILDNGLSLLSNVSNYRINKSAGYFLTSVRSKPFSSNRDMQISLFKGEELLKIDINSFNDKVDGIIDGNNIINVSYNKEYLIRSLKVIQHMLQRTEGIVWERI